MRSRKCLQYLVCACLLVYIYYFLGVSDYMNTKSFEAEFDYPLNIDIKPIVKEVLIGKKPSVLPVNYYPYRYLTNSGKCSTLEKLDLFIVVKSAMDHFDQRDAIRKTYGQEHFMPGRIIKTLFFLGTEGHRTQTQQKIDEEMAQYKDIIQMDFHDAYFNNTIKTMMSFRWLYEHCSIADHYLFTDDDMYISVKNLLEYVEETQSATNEHDEASFWYGDKEKILYAGYMFKSTPQRFRSSKWRVSLDEYRWSKWPAYVTAGAYVVSNRCMKIMYVASLFVKHFRFDDIYLGIVAKKAGVTPVHSNRFYFYKKKYDKEGFKDVIASHGYESEELVKVWLEQHLI
ncbi:beta-1,3-galactosyltransferase brn-like isoform X1 [Aricia agestis]|uniref:beta-1,3-galactosyltransferase brn-like isoform X1 n=1 Tax=Aricia agestis TaxID=91739 RepID=UPI001C2024C1|nr:beta-1,3-galactosyltransferase brn-like isoform X1 [Aricia agestis]